MGQERCSASECAARVVVGVGLSSASKHALNWAASNLIRGPEDTLVLLHVVSTLPALPAACKENSKFSLGMGLEREVVLCQSEATPELLHHHLKTVVQPMLDVLKELVEPSISLEVHVAHHNSKRKGILEACGKLRATALVLGTPPVGMLRIRKEISITCAYFMRHSPCWFSVHVVRKDKVVACKDPDSPLPPPSNKGSLKEKPGCPTSAPSGRRRSLDMGLLRKIGSASPFSSPWAASTSTGQKVDGTCPWAASPSREQKVGASPWAASPAPTDQVQGARVLDAHALAARVPSRPLTPLFPATRSSTGAASVCEASLRTEEEEFQAPLQNLTHSKPASEPASCRKSMSREDSLREMEKLQLMVDEAEKATHKAELCAIRAMAEVEAKKVKQEHEMLQEVRFALLRGGVEDDSSF